MFSAGQLQNNFFTANIFLAIRKTTTTSSLKHTDFNHNWWRNTMGAKYFQNIMTEKQSKTSFCHHQYSYPRLEIRQ